MIDWIRVKNATPNINQEVLIYRSDCILNKIEVYIYRGNDMWEDDYGYIGSAEECGVTHWMPTPEPPRY